MSKKNYHDYEIGPCGGKMKKYRRYKATQCTSYERGRKDQEHRRCQGVRGHDGWHWYYRPDGWLIEWPRKKDKSKIAHSSTPPGHQNYINPKDKQKDHHTSYDRVVELGTANDD